MTSALSQILVIYPPGRTQVNLGVLLGSILPDVKIQLAGTFSEGKNLLSSTGPVLVLVGDNFLQPTISASLRSLHTGNPQVRILLLCSRSRENLSSQDLGVDGILYDDFSSQELLNLTDQKLWTKNPLPATSNPQSRGFSIQEHP